MDAKLSYKNVIRGVNCTIENDQSLVAVARDKSDDDPSLIFTKM